VDLYRIIVILHSGPEHLNITTKLIFQVIEVCSCLYIYTEV